MPFGSQLFPHHDDGYPQQYLCEVVPSSREAIFSDEEPLPATTKEPYVGSLLLVNQPVWGIPRVPLLVLQAFIWIPLT